MSEEARMFGKITQDKAAIIWRTVKTDPISGRRKGILEAERLTGITRETIGKFLDVHPVPAKTRKIAPQFETTWMNCKGYKDIIDWHSRYTKVTKGVLNARLSFARECWKFLKHKDPISWDIDDFHALRENPAFFDVERAKQAKREPVISAPKLVFLRTLIKALGHKEWVDEFPTEGTKRAAGQKSDWWLRKEEVDKLEAELQQEPSTYVLFVMAVNTGGRIGSYYQAQINSLHLENKGREWWAAFETKTGTPVRKVLTAKVVGDLQEYLIDLRFGGKGNPEDLLFPRGEDFYSDRLKEAGIRAGICYRGFDKKSKKDRDDMIHGSTLSWHITRHTFATHLAIMKVPLNYIMEQGPWKDASTLLGFYAGSDPEEMRDYMNKLNL